MKRMLLIKLTKMKDLQNHPVRLSNSTHQTTRNLRRRRKSKLLLLRRSRKKRLKSTARS